MKNPNKLLCLLLAFAMLLSLSACAAKGGEGDAAGGTEGAVSASSNPGGDAEAPSPQDASGSEAAVEEAPSYKVALFPTQGENQSVPEAGKAYCEARGLEYLLVDQTQDTDKDRAAALEQAAQEGCNVVLVSGQEYADTMTKCASKYPDVKFLAVGLDLDSVPGNVWCIGFQEEAAGFMAGYMAVKLGYTGLAFLGRESNDSDARYGSGFLQGADCAAMEMGLMNQISMEYGTCEPSGKDDSVAAAAAEWYKKGTQVIFTTGYYEAVGKAAAQAKGLVIGANDDQSALINQNGKELTLTCAVRNSAAAAAYGLDVITVSDTWSQHAGQAERLGVVDGSDPGRNAVGLSENSAWDVFFDQDDYESLADQIADNGIIISDTDSQKLNLLFKVNYQTLG